MLNSYLRDVLSHFIKFISPPSLPGPCCHPPGRFGNVLRDIWVRVLLVEVRIPFNMHSGQESLTAQHDPPQMENPYIMMWTELVFPRRNGRFEEDHLLPHLISRVYSRAHTSS
jgi:hypothetical protein